ncbi:MAG: Trk system potassium transporter TrkA [Oscillospiraceae bacterium]|nr:Trk system potassium transporter TrkA [Oscillospiraceae bacterium]
MRIIIVGCGKIGAALAWTLSEKKDCHVTVVDKIPNVLETSGEIPDVIFIAGNGVNENILRQADAKNADLIVCTTNSDELNILCCIMAERLGTKHSIARVRNPEYMLEFNRLWKDLGIDMAINPEWQTARVISRILRYPAADDIETFIDGRVELVSFKISESPEYFIGKSISKIFNRKMGILLALVQRGDAVSIPHGDFVFEHGDVIKIMGRASKIMAFFALLKKIPKSQDIMVIGGGRITYYLAELLNRHTIKTSMRIIEKDRDKCESLCETLTSANLAKHLMFIHGDGTDEDLLAAENIEKMDAFICLTDRDEENAIISLYALKTGVKKVITKVTHLHQNMIKSLITKLGNIIAPQDITKDIILRYIDGFSGVSDHSIVTVHQIFSSESETVNAVEFNISKNAKCLGTPIQNLKINKDVLLGCISRGSEIIIPSGETALQIGDRVVAISKFKELREIDDIIT